MKKFVILLLLLSTLFNCTILNDKEQPSSDEGKIVFSMPESPDRGTYQIYKMNPDGSGQIKLTNIKKGGAYDPAWSPDGKQIAFTSSQKSTSVGHSLYLMDADGANKRPMKLLPDNNKIAYSGNYPNWSPDGEKIAYSFCNDCNSFGLNDDILIYDTTSDSIYSVFTHPASDTSPKWSPDGESIAFTSNRDYYQSIEDSANTDIYLIDATGTNLRRLTDTGNAGRQLWFSSGEELLYWSENQLFRLNIETNNSELIPVNLSSEIGFRPLSFVEGDNKILLDTFSFDSSKREHSLYILDLVTQELTKIKSANYFFGASWSEKEN